MVQIDNKRRQEDSRGVNDDLGLRFGEIECSPTDAVHDIDLLDRGIFGTLSSEEIETLVDLLTRISTSAQLPVED